MTDTKLPPADAENVRVFVQGHDAVPDDNAVAVAVVQEIERAARAFASPEDALLRVWRQHLRTRSCHHANLEVDNFLEARRILREEGGEQDENSDAADEVFERSREVYWGDATRTLSDFPRLTGALRKSGDG
jgi:hypothetical protein